MFNEDNQLEGFSYNLDKSQRYLDRLSSIDGPDNKEELILRESVGIVLHQTGRITQ